MYKTLKAIDKVAALYPEIESVSADIEGIWVRHRFGSACFVTETVFHNIQDFIRWLAQAQQ